MLSVNYNNNYTKINIDGKTINKTWTQYRKTQGEMGGNYGIKKKKQFGYKRSCHKIKEKTKN